MQTRADYLAHRISHQGYYAQFVTPQIIQLVKTHIGLPSLLASTDPYLNDIPLRRWDAFHSSIWPQARKLASANGGGVSLSDTVCVAKAAAHILIGRAQPAQPAQAPSEET